MRMTIGSVMDDINEWQGPNGAVYYVTAFFTNSEMLSCGKKDMDAALEVKGLLQEIIEVPQEFILEPKGQTKKGAAKWNLKAFGPPEGVWTYSTIKDGSPNVGVEGAGNPGGDPIHKGRVAGSIPVVGPPLAPTNNVDASIRASVALKAAAVSYSGRDVGTVGILDRAEVFDAWLAKKSSGVTPQGSPEETGEGVGTGEGPAPSSTHWQERVKDWPDPSQESIGRDTDADG